MLAHMHLPRAPVASGVPLFQEWVSLWFCPCQAQHMSRSMTSTLSSPRVLGEIIRFGVHHTVRCRAWGLVLALVGALCFVAFGLVPAASAAPPRAWHSAAWTGASDDAARWFPPLQSPFAVTGPYRTPPNPYGSGHRGIDLPTTSGASVVAPTDGTVSFSGMVAGRGVISVRVDELTVVSIEPIASGFSAGDRVQAGEKLGVVGKGGHCVGAAGEVECIHLGVRVDGAYVNPLRYFFGRPRLLPW